MSKSKVGREYGFVKVEKRVGKTGAKWRAVIGYREHMADGTSKRGHINKTLDTPASDKNERGKNTALKEAQKLKDKLIADEPRRLSAQNLKRKEKLSDNPTVSEFLAYYLNKLLPAEKKINGLTLEQSTMLGYRRYERMLKESHAGSIKLSHLTKEDVADYREELKRKDYAPTTIRNAMRLLSTALKAASKLRLIEENPADGVGLPSIEKASSEINYLEHDERERLLADLNQTLHNEMAHDEQRAPEKSYMALGIKLALLTGMREGEICALRWSNIDLDNGIISVKAAIGRTNSGFYIKAPKSTNSLRDIPIDEELVADLNARKKEMQKLADKGHIEWSEDMFALFEPNYTIEEKESGSGAEKWRSEDGNDWQYLKPIHLWRSWSRRVKRLNLKGKTGEAPKFHDLRHTFATVAAHSGKIPKIQLLLIMGHSDISVTSQYYIGIDDNATRQAMRDIRAAM